MAAPKVQAITGYVPITQHPRPVAEYGELGEKLGSLRHKVLPFYRTLRDLWLTMYLWENSLKPKQPDSDNPTKDSVAYCCVQHQKVRWMIEAAHMTDADVFVWIDYGIFHVPGVTQRVIDEFLDRVEPEVAIPGCWEDAHEVGPEPICWRFCGGVLVIDRESLVDFENAQSTEIKRIIKETGKITWEVNTWANMEFNDTMPPHRWYKADHNEQLFTEY